MNKLILSLVMMTSSVAFSQEYYMAKHSKDWDYDYRLGKYQEVSSKQEYTTIIISREWFAMEDTKDNYLRWEWVHYDELEGLGTCYIIEDDSGMACINSTSNKFFLFVNFNGETEKWDDALVLSDIHKIPSFNITWDKK
jgi:hypothetical protein